MYYSCTTCKIKTIIVSPDPTPYRSNQSNSNPQKLTIIIIFIENTPEIKMTPKKSKLPHTNKIKKLLNFHRFSNRKIDRPQKQNIHSSKINNLAHFVFHSIRHALENIFFHLVSYSVYICSPGIAILSLVCIIT